MDPLKNLISYYNNGENSIFHYIISRIIREHKLFFDGSIYDVADSCSSSPATISRLAQRAGARNYTDFKNTIYQTYKSYKYVNRTLHEEEGISDSAIVPRFFSEMSNNMDTVQASLDMDTINSVVNALQQADCVKFYTDHKNFSEQRLQINLMKKSRDSQSIQRLIKQEPSVDDLSENDMAFGITSDTQDAMDIMVLLMRCSEKGVKTVLITNNPSSPFRNKVDFFLAFKGTGAGIDDYGLYAIVDIINLLYRKRWVDRDGPQDFNAR